MLYYVRTNAGDLIVSKTGDDCRILGEQDFDDDMEKASPMDCLKTVEDDSSWTDKDFDFNAVDGESDSPVILAIV